MARNLEQAGGTVHRKSNFRGASFRPPLLPASSSFRPLGPRRTRHSGRRVCRRARHSGRRCCGNGPESNFHPARPPKHL